MLRNVKRVVAAAAVIAVVTVLLQGVASAATPTVPTGLTATPGNKSVVLSWTASSNVHTDYIIQ